MPDRVEAIGSPLKAERKLTLSSAASGAGFFTNDLSEGGKQIRMTDGLGAGGTGLNMSGPTSHKGHPVSPVPEIRFRSPVGTAYRMLFCSQRFDIGGL